MDTNAHRSDIPYCVGMRVIERVGDESSIVRITAMRDNIVQTQTRRWYNRDTGGAVPSPDGLYVQRGDGAGYRAIHSVGYAGTK